ncbi:MAG: hypothetical protein IMW90_00345 [Thermogemmatispora sp.]|uniref:hypothetical protein n=1 Tax=Thermogemmatispora sp. TaxID=1968838 RepID=UPI0019FE12AA|nr:hypothetical protein [Thermogemmatispora sp.]MBE3564156.1 hypothetical protein [Thermogemmatispora sp.]
MLRWLICLTGLLVVGLGLVVGWHSHQVTYRSSGRGTIAHYLSDPQTHEGYLQLEGSPTLYLLREQDFLPPIKGTATLKDLMLVALLYRPDESTEIDVRAQLGTHLVGSAYPVVALTLYNLDGAVTQEFKSTLYRQNPQGFYENDWPLGGGVSLLGAVLSLGGGASLWKRGRKRSERQARPVQRPTPAGPPLAPLAPSLRLPSRPGPSGSGGGHSGLRPPSGPPLSGPRP